TSDAEQVTRVMLDRTANALLLVGHHTAQGTQKSAWFVMMDTSGAVQVSKYYTSASNAEFLDITRNGNTYLMVGASSTGALMVQTDLLGSTTCLPIDLALQSGHYSAPLSQGVSHYTENLYLFAQTEWYEHHAIQANTVCSSCNHAVVNQTVQACGSYTHKQQVYTQSGVYGDTVPLPNGCDSIFLLHLTIYEPPTPAVVGPNQN